MQLSDDFRNRVLTILDSSREDTATNAKRLENQLRKQLKTLDAKEDRYLDLVGDPDWPKEKLAARMRKVREEKAQVAARLSEKETPLAGSYELLETAVRLLADPLGCTSVLPSGHGEHSTRWSSRDCTSMPMPSHTWPLTTYKSRSRRCCTRPNPA